jgi:hypothetical protein
VAASRGWYATPATRIEGAREPEAFLVEHVAPGAATKYRQTLTALGVRLIIAQVIAILHGG